MEISCQPKVKSLKYLVLSSYMSRDEAAKLSTYVLQNKTWHLLVQLFLRLQFWTPVVPILHHIKHLFIKLSN